MLMRTLLSVFILLTITGCQQPFGSDRHDLDGFRILGLHTTPSGGITGDEIEPRAHFVIDGQLWSDQSIEQYWFWMTTADPATLASKTKEDADAVGAAPELVIPYRNATLGLLAKHPDGTEKRAFVTLPTTSRLSTDPGTILTFQTSQALSGLTVDDLDIDQRAEWDLVQTPTFSPDTFGRLEVYFNDTEQQPYRIRWMSTGPFGTFFETTASTSDWAPAKVTLDDDEVSVGDTIANGPRTFVALILDLEAPRTVQYREVWLGTPTPGVWIHGRWYAHDTPVDHTGLATVVFTEDDSAPTGLKIGQWSPLDPEMLSETDPYGTAALSCSAPVSGPFQQEWLTLNWCVRSDISGTPLVVEVHP